MDIAPENILFTGSILLLVSVIAGKTTDRLGVPTLIFFLVIGILAGSEGIGGIKFDNYHVAELIGIVSLNFILFSGGLDTNWQSIKPVLWKGIALSTIGVFLTAFSVGLFVYYVLNFSLLEGLLLGAIVSSTDAAAVFSILRNQGIGLKGNLRPVLELESGSNDPMAYFLTISLTTLLANRDMQFYQLIPLFIKGFIIGGLMGYAMGKLSHWLINNIRLNSDGLYPVLVLGLAMFTYAATDFLGGNGFLAIYLCALILGNSNFIHKRSMIRFYDGQAWLMQIIMFLTLGLLVFPSKVLPVIGIGLLISAFLIFVARPIGVFVSLAFFKVNIRSKLFLSWVGLRGAVPIVFATYPMIAGLPKAELIFNLVFFISVSSVLLQGTTLSFIARLLHLDVPQKVKRRMGADIEIEDKEKSEMVEIVIDAASPVNGKKIVTLDIPKAANIMTIKRGEKYLIPVGSTRLLAGDKLQVLAEDKKTMQLVYDALHIKE
ncbi:MAG: potassium/proton antiporter [Bacteroidota bacterium]